MINTFDLKQLYSRAIKSTTQQQQLEYMAELVTRLHCLKEEQMARKEQEANELEDMLEGMVMAGRTRILELERARQWVMERIQEERRVVQRLMGELERSQQQQIEFYVLKSKLKIAGQLLQALLKLQQTVTCAHSSHKSATLTAKYQKETLLSQKHKLQREIDNLQLQSKTTKRHQNNLKLREENAWLRITEDNRRASQQSRIRKRQEQEYRSITGRGIVEPPANLVREIESQLVVEKMGGLEGEPVVINLRQKEMPWGLCLAFLLLGLAFAYIAKRVV